MLQRQRLLIARLCGVVFPLSFDEADTAMLHVPSMSHCCPCSDVNFPCLRPCRLQLSGSVVELIGTFEDRSCVYIVMEECRGGDLETLLEVNVETCCLDQQRAVQTDCMPTRILSQLLLRLESLT